MQYKGFLFITISLNSLIPQIILCNLICCILFHILFCFLFSFRCGIKMNTCTNKGCMQSFKWPTQLARHMKNCNFPPVEVQKDYFKNSDDLFECRKSSKTFKYQSNVSRHKNVCKGQNVSVNKCTQCDKEFKYQSRLNKHSQVHEKNISQVCSNCCISFRRTYHFQKHIEHCGKGNKMCDTDW